MFWQGGGKKRIQQILQTRLQPIREHIDLPSIRIARTDEQLLYLYYHRNQLHEYDHQISANWLQQKQPVNGKDHGGGTANLANIILEKRQGVEQGKMNLLWLAPRSNAKAYQDSQHNQNVSDEKQMSLISSNNSKIQDRHVSEHFLQNIKKSKVQQPVFQSHRASRLMTEHNPEQ